MEFRIADTFTDSLAKLTGEEHPGEPGDRRPGRPPWSATRTLSQHAVTRARGLAAVLHAADHSKHVANIAAAAFTAIAG
jgi:hypothetical protein